VQGSLAPDRNDEYHLYQTLVGVWPFDSAPLHGEFIDRITIYMLKTIREAQVHSSWINPNVAYEKATTGFVQGILTATQRNHFPEELSKLTAETSRIGAFNSLSQHLLKLTAPGVPDIYQGTEFWDFSLVDPDNRRAVDFSQRTKLLKVLKRRKPGPKLAARLLDDLASGAIKLFITQRQLAHRAVNAGLYAFGDYTPLEVVGPLAAHVVAFHRVVDGSELIVVVPRLIGSLVRKPAASPVGEIWRDTIIVLPAGAVASSYENIFTGRQLTTRLLEETPALDLADVLADLPVASLERIEAARSKR